jgi:DNA-directed RNA polymerase specialized sigma24 family protein
MDQLVEPYLFAANTGVEQEHLADLLKTHAEPVIRRTVASRLSGLWEDIDDVCSEARLELLLHLRRLKTESAVKTIDDFPSYVATLATNSCNHYFQRRRPGRARLKKQTRFLLQHDPLFRLSKGPDRRDWCGLAEWKQDREFAGAETLHDLAGRVEGDRNLTTLLRRILEEAGGAICFEPLVDVVARLWRILPDPEPLSNPVNLDSIPAIDAETEVSIDRRRYATRLWGEVRELPRAQRLALLLNIRDGRGNSVLSLFPLMGIASFREIAVILDVSETELASMWTRLPCDDEAIGKLLGCARQQVINLRMAGRKRLANRLGRPK